MANRSSRRAEIVELLTTREAKGLTFKALAERSGIPVGTLSYWSHKLRRESNRDDRHPGFVELQPAPSDRSSTSSKVRIEHDSGLVIEFEGEAAITATERLVGRDRAPWS